MKDNKLFIALAAFLIGCFILTQIDFPNPSQPTSTLRARFPLKSYTSYWYYNPDSRAATNEECIKPDNAEGRWLLFKKDLPLQPNYDKP